MASIILLLLISILLIKILWNPNIDTSNKNYTIIWYTPLFNRYKRNYIKINV